jgi:hypothetical protein
MLDGDGGLSTLRSLAQPPRGESLALEGGRS